MKYLLFLIILMLATKGFSYDMPLKVIDLNEKEKFLVELMKQEEGELGQVRLKLRRTAKTENHVALRFALKRYTDVCVREGYVSAPVERRFRRYEGSYDYYKTCIEFENKFEAYNKKITLHFNKARKLKEGEEEIIIVKISQKEIESTSVDLSAEVEGVPYKTTKVGRGFLRSEGLRFTLK